MPTNLSLALDGIRKSGPDLLLTETGRLVPFASRKHYGFNNIHLRMIIILLDGSTIGLDRKPLLHKLKIFSITHVLYYNNKNKLTGPFEWNDGEDYFHDI